MSRTSVRYLSVVALVFGCGVLAKGNPGGRLGPDPAPSAEWEKDSPAPGGNKKEVTCSVKWANCTNATKVEVVLYKTVMGAYVEVGRKNNAITLATGTWATTVTGLTSGTVITAADVRVTNAAGQMLAASFKENISVTVP